MPTTAQYDNCWWQLNSHYENCPACALWYARGSGHIRYVAELGYRGMVCPTCAQSLPDYLRTPPHRCTGCGYWLFDPDEVTCPECTANRDLQQIHEYGHKPEPIFHSRADERQPLYLGVELEVVASGSQDAGLRAIASVTGRSEEKLYCKEDSSLDDEGIEIVTHPCTLAYHQQEFGWEELLGALREQGAVSHDTNCCGLHVHINRDFFATVAQECAVGVFIYSHFRACATSESRPVINRLARRTPGTFCKATDAYKTTLQQHQQRRNHSDAVNYANEATIEIRCARGTLKLESLYTWLEFVAAVAHWVRETVTNDAAMDRIADTATSWQDFTTWLHVQAESTSKYDHLIATLAQYDLPACETATDNAQISPELY